MVEMSEIDYKAKYNKIRKKYDKAKPYFRTMERHNNRLQNENNALSTVLESFRETIKELCPHKAEWLDYSRKTVWGDEERHFCDKCKTFILAEDIDRKI